MYSIYSAVLPDSAMHSFSRESIWRAISERSTAVKYAFCRRLFRQCWAHSKPSCYDVKWALVMMMIPMVEIPPNITVTKPRSVDGWGRSVDGWGRPVIAWWHGMVPYWGGVCLPSSGSWWGAGLEKFYCIKYFNTDTLFLCVYQLQIPDTLRVMKESVPNTA